MEASRIVVYQFYLNPSATMDGSILYSSLSVLFLSALSSSDFIEILMIWFNFSLWQITVSLIFQFLWIKKILGCYKNTSLNITFFLTLLLKIWTLWIAFLKIILSYFFSYFPHFPNFFPHVFLIFLIFFSYLPHFPTLFLMFSTLSSYFLYFPHIFPYFPQILIIFLIFFLYFPHIFLIFLIFSSCSPFSSYFSHFPHIFLVKER